MWPKWTWPLHNVHTHTQHPLIFTWAPLQCQLTAAGFGMNIHIQRDKEHIKLNWTLQTWRAWINILLYTHTARTGFSIHLAGETKGTTGRWFKVSTVLHDHKRTQAHTLTPILLDIFCMLSDQTRTVDCMKAISANTYVRFLHIWKWFPCWHVQSQFVQFMNTHAHSLSSIHRSSLSGEVMSLSSIKEKRGNVI